MDRQQLEFFANQIEYDGFICGARNFCRVRKVRYCGVLVVAAGGGWPTLGKTPPAQAAGKGATL